MLFFLGATDNHFQNMKDSASSGTQTSIWDKLKHLKRQGDDPDGIPLVLSWNNCNIAYKINLKGSNSGKESQCFRGNQLKFKLEPSKG